NAGIGENARELRAGRLIERDVGDESAAKERRDPMPGAVDELVGDQKFARGELFFERTDGAHRDDAIDAEQFEGKDVGAIVVFGRKNGWAGAGGGEEGDVFSFQQTGDEGLGGIAEGIFDADSRGMGEAFQGEKAAPADDSYACLV